MSELGNLNDLNDVIHENPNLGIWSQSRSGDIVITEIDGVPHIEGLPEWEHACSEFEKFSRDWRGIIENSAGFPVFIDDISKTMALFRLPLSAMRSLDTASAALKKQNISDAYMLVRKFRDDLILYLDICISNEEYFAALAQRNHAKEEPSRAGRKLLEKWLTYRDAFDDDGRPYINSVREFKKLIALPKYQEFDKAFGISARFDVLGKRLNDYVHGNGIYFINCNFELLLRDYGKDFRSWLEGVCHDMVESVLFIFLVFFAMYSMSRRSALESQDDMEFYIWEMNHGRNPRHCAMPILSEYMNFGETVVGKGFAKYLENATGVIIID